MEPLVDVTGARRRRARAAARRRWRAVAIVLAVVAVVGGGVWLVWFSPAFTASTLRVEGNTLLTTAQVEAAASVPLGGPLAQVDTAGAEQRVGALPAVSRAGVERRWPDTVLITVTERVAVLAIPLGTRYVWVDAQGVAFHDSPEPPADTMLADASSADTEVLSAMARVAGALPDAVRAQAAEISASSVESIVVRLRDGRRIVWGSDGESALKARVIVPLLGVPGTVYDVSAPSHPTTR